MKRRESAPSVINEEELARGNTVPVTSDSTLMMNFFRAYRGRNDYSQLIETMAPNEFWAQLEIVKSSLLEGNFSKAQQILGTLKAADDLQLAEFLVEKARYELFNQNPVGALECTGHALLLRELSELSRMTCHQLRGHAFIELKNYAAAKEELSRGITLSEFFPLAESGMTCRVFLVVMYSELGQKREAKAQLTELFGQLEKISTPNLFLTRLVLVLRGEVHFTRNFGLYEACRDTLYEIIALAEFLEMKDMRSRCQIELDEHLLSRKPGVGKPAVFRFQGWSFIPSRHIVLHHSAKTLVSTLDFPVRHKMLCALAEGPMTQEDLFARVWGRVYDPLIDDMSLRANLSKLRKLLPVSALVTTDGVVHLK